MPLPLTSIAGVASDCVLAYTSSMPSLALLRL